MFTTDDPIYYVYPTLYGVFLYNNVMGRRVVGIYAPQTKSSSDKTKWVTHMVHQSHICETAYQSELGVDLSPQNGLSM